MIAFGTVAGGAGAALTGGNFWQGAVTGLVVSGLNHLGSSLTEDASEINEKIRKSNTNDVAEGDVVNLHNNGSALDLWAQQSKPNKGTVELHAHGSSSSIGGMTSVTEISDLLYEKSPTWRSMKDNGEKITLKLFSCETGKGTNSIASKIV